MSAVISPMPETKEMSMPTRPTHANSATPARQPKNAPSAPIKVPSSRKRPMIWRPFMPSAASTPISRVRSKTAIN